MSGGPDRSEFNERMGVLEESLGIEQNPDDQGLPADEDERWRRKGRVRQAQVPRQLGHPDWGQQIEPMNSPEVGRRR